MIIELYTFSPSSFVVAEEWNANFRTLQKSAIEHSDSIKDGFETLAFPDSDLTAVFNSVRGRSNSHSFNGNSITESQLYAEQEYYGEVSSQLNVTIPVGMNGEARILVHLLSNQSLLPFNINYNGTKIVNHFNNYVFRAGYYYLMIYESNNVAQVKIIWTGV